MERAKLGKITNTVLNDLRQRVIKIIASKNTFTAEEYGPWGIDSNPINDATAMYVRTERDGDEAMIAYLTKDKKSERGETRLYCTDATGAFKFNLWLRADGKLLIGNSDNPASYVDFAVKYNNLKLEYDKTKLYIATMRTALQTALVSIDAVVPGTSAAFIATMLGQVLGDIASSKNDKIKY